MAEEMGAVDWCKMNSLGVLVAASFGYLQYISDLQGQGVRCVQAEFRTVPLYFTISLVGLTASMRPPASKRFKISILFLILGCASLLSSILPSKLTWVPYLSCIRPFFHLLPDPLQEGILQFSQTLWDRVEQRIRSAIQGLQTVDATPVAFAPSSSSSTLANSNLGGLIGEEVISDASTSSASTSTEAQLQLVTV